ncbi:MAG TPA: hypothetical protein VFN11_10685 [Ktedonobacterales bacterium]|nr:hypothetical protein [Ktedonobacterales bacterium]
MYRTMYRTSFASLPPPSPVSAPAARKRWLLPWMAGAVCLLGIITLSACGATTGSASKSLPANTPIVMSPGGASLNPCPGAGGALAKTPQRVLTLNDSHKTTQVHTGDVVEVQLQANMHWTVQVDTVSSILKLLQPQGGVDGTTNTCRWLYAVSSAGSAHLTFIGTPLCESAKPCPTIAEDEEFSIQAS